MQFRTAFRQVMVDAVLVPSNESNCIEDVDTFLFTLKSIVPDTSAISVPTPSTPASALLTDLPVNVRSLLSVNVLEPHLSQEESNIVVSIAGYICRKVRGKVCDDYRDELASTPDPGNPAHTFLFEKSYGDTVKDGLIAPSSNLYDLVEGLEQEYSHVVSSVIHMEHVRYRLVTALDKKAPTELFDCAQCASRSMIVNLFVNIRLHHSLKEANRDFCSRGRKNRKVLKFNHA